MFWGFVKDVFLPLVGVLASTVALLAIVAGLLGIAGISVPVNLGSNTTYAVTLPSGETLHGLQLEYDSLEGERTRFTTPDGKVLVVKGPHVIVEETQAEREGK